MAEVLALKHAIRHRRRRLRGQSRNAMPQRGQCAPWDSSNAWPQPQVDFDARKIEDSVSDEASIVIVAISRLLRWSNCLHIRCS